MNGPEGFLPKNQNFTTQVAQILWYRPFKNNNKLNAQTILCLDGIASDDLENIMDYIYNGEVKIFQENIDRFLSIAQKLKLEGLISNDDTQNGGNQEAQNNDYVEDKFYANKEDAVLDDVSCFQRK